MTRILIFQHAAHEGPGYFAEYLERRRIAHEIVRADAGDAVPAGLDGVAGLAFMGGPMSVNDPLPWVAQEVALIRRAVDADVPVIGHCLGGQLMARALGSAVTRNPVREIGWFPVRAVEGEAAREWLGPLPRSFSAYHWHGETFAIPPGASHLLASADCPNQGFAQGPHLALQCHVEMTPKMIADWAAQAGPDLKVSRTVQGADDMLRDVERRVHDLHAVADVLYDCWTRNLR